MILGVDESIDDGITLALALRCRATILISLGRGEEALSDLKLAATYGLDSKQSVDYYMKMAQAYASKCQVSIKSPRRLNSVPT